MQLKTILLISVLLLPILSIASDTDTESNTTLESMDIKTLIEEAKLVSSHERTKIENLIKQKIAKAHREKQING